MPPSSKRDLIANPLSIMAARTAQAAKPVQTIDDIDEWLRGSKDLLADLEGISADIDAEQAALPDDLGTPSRANAAYAAQGRREAEARRRQNIRAGIQGATTVGRMALPMAAGVLSGGAVLPVLYATAGATGLAQGAEALADDYAGTPQVTAREQLGDFAGSLVGNAINIPGGALMARMGTNRAGRAAAGGALGVLEGMLGNVADETGRAIVGRGELPTQDVLEEQAGLGAGIGGVLGATFGALTGGKAPTYRRGQSTAQSWGAGAPIATGPRLLPPGPTPDNPVPGGLVGRPAGGTDFGGPDALDEMVLDVEAREVGPTPLLPPGPGGPPQLPPPSSIVPPPPPGFTPPPPGPAGPGAFARPTSHDVLSPEYLQRVQGPPPPAPPEWTPDAILNRMVLEELATNEPPRVSIEDVPAQELEPGAVVPLPQPMRVGQKSIVAVDATDTTAPKFLTEDGTALNLKPETIAKLFPWLEVAEPPQPTRRMSIERGDPRVGYTDAATGRKRPLPEGEPANPMADMVPARPEPYEFRPGQREELEGRFGPQYVQQAARNAGGRLEEPVQPAERPQLASERRQLRPAPQERGTPGPQVGDTVWSGDRQQRWNGTRWEPVTADAPPANEADIDIEALLREADELEAGPAVAPRADADLAPNERRLRHSSFKTFDQFARDSASSDGNNRLGHWFTDSDTAHFGPIDYDAAVRMENPYAIGTREQLAQEIEAAGGPEAFVAARKAEGHDGLTLTEPGPDGKPMNTFVAFDDGQARVLGRNMRDQGQFDRFASDGDRAAWDASNQPAKPEVESPRVNGAEPSDPYNGVDLTPEEKALYDRKVGPKAYELTVEEHSRAAAIKNRVEMASPETKARIEEMRRLNEQYRDPVDELVEPTPVTTTETTPAAKKPKVPRATVQGEGSQHKLGRVFDGTYNGKPAVEVAFPSKEEAPQFAREALRAAGFNYFRETGRWGYVVDGKPSKRFGTVEEAQAFARQVMDSDPPTEAPAADPLRARAEEPVDEPQPARDAVDELVDPTPVNEPVVRAEEPEAEQPRNAEREPVYDVEDFPEVADGQPPMRAELAEGFRDGVERWQVVRGNDTSRELRGEFKGGYFQTQEAAEDAIDAHRAKLAKLNAADAPTDAPANPKFPRQLVEEWISASGRDGEGLASGMVTRFAKLADKAMGRPITQPEFASLMERLPSLSTLQSQAQVDRAVTKAAKSLLPEPPKPPGKKKPKPAPVASTAEPPPAPEAEGPTPKAEASEPAADAPRDPSPAAELPTIDDGAYTVKASKPATYNGRKEFHVAVEDTANGYERRLKVAQSRGSSDWGVYYENRKHPGATKYAPAVDENFATFSTKVQAEQYAEAVLKRTLALGGDEMIPVAHADIEDAVRYNHEKRGLKNPIDVTVHFGKYKPGTNEREFTTRLVPMEAHGGWNVQRMGGTQFALAHPATGLAGFVYDSLADARAAAKAMSPFLETIAKRKVDPTDKAGLAKLGKDVLAAVGRAIDAGVVARRDPSGSQSESPYAVPNAKNLDEAADAVVDAAKDVPGGGTTLGAGLGGLQALNDLYKRDPAGAWFAMRTVGGAVLGAAYGEATEEEGDTFSSMVMGAAAAGAAGPAMRAIRAKAPELAKALTGAFGDGGKRVVQYWDPSFVGTRRPRDLSKDLGGLAKYFQTPDKAVPDVFRHVRPILDTMDQQLAELAATKPPQYVEMVRKAYVAEAVGVMKRAALQARRQKHYNRAEYVEKLAEALNQTPTGYEKVLAGVSGADLGTVRKYVSTANQAFYHYTLGWALDSAIGNLTQPGLTGAFIGPVPTTKGLLEAISKGGRERTQFLRLERPQGHEDNTAFFRKYFDWAQTPMRESDTFNRRTAYLGTLEYAKARGLDPQQAHEFAIEMTGATQGVPGDLGDNPFWRELGPIRALTRWPRQWAQITIDAATHPDPRVAARMVGLLSGAAAASSVMGVSLLNFVVPRMIGFPFAEAAVDVAKHAAGDDELDHEMRDHLTPFNPHSVILPRYIEKLGSFRERTAAAGTEPRTVRNRSGLPNKEVTFGEDALSLFGLETTGASEERDARSEMYDFAAEARQEQAIDSRRARRDAARAMDAGDDEAFESAMEQLTPDQRKRFMRDLQTTPRDRIRRTVPRERRDEFDELFPER